MVNMVASQKQATAIGTVCAKAHIASMVDMASIDPYLTALALQIRYDCSSSKMEFHTEKGNPLRSVDWPQKKKHVRRTCLFFVFWKHQELLEFCCCASFGKFLLDLFSIFLRSCFFDLGRNAFNQLLGVHQR